MILSIILIASILASISLVAGAWAAPNFRNAIKGFWKKYGRRFLVSFCVIIFLLQVYITIAFGFAVAGLKYESQIYLVLSTLMVLIPGIISILVANKNYRVLKENKILNAINEFLSESDNEIIDKIKLSRNDIKKLQSGVSSLCLYFFFLTIIFFFNTIDPEFARMGKVLFAQFAFVLLVLIFWVSGIYRNRVSHVPGNFFITIFILELFFLGFSYTPVWADIKTDWYNYQVLAIVTHDFELLDENLQPSGIKVVAKDTVRIEGYYHEKDGADQKLVRIVTRKEEYKEKGIPVYNGKQGLIYASLIKKIDAKSKDKKEETAMDTVKVDGVQVDSIETKINISIPPEKTMKMIIPANSTNFDTRAKINSNNGGVLEIYNSSDEKIYGIEKSGEDEWEYPINPGWNSYNLIRPMGESLKIAQSLKSIGLKINIKEN